MSPLFYAVGVSGIIYCSIRFVSPLLSEFFSRQMSYPIDGLSLGVFMAFVCRHIISAAKLQQILHICKRSGIFFEKKGKIFLNF